MVGTAQVRLCPPYASRRHHDFPTKNPTPIATTAQQHGFVYGLITAFMALMTGWMASIVFRKD